MSRRNGGGGGTNPKLDLKLHLSPPRAHQPMIGSQNHLVSPTSSCLSSELVFDDTSLRYSTSPEATTMMLVGCPRCLMYIMLAEDYLKCPKCKSTVLLDVVHDNVSKTNKNVDVDVGSSLIYAIMSPFVNIVNIRSDRISCKCDASHGRLLKLYGQENNIKLITKDLKPFEDVGPQKCLAFSTGGSKFAARGWYIRRASHDLTENLQSLGFESDWFKTGIPARGWRTFYLPPVTSIVVQNRHHTPFFPDRYGDKDTIDRSGDILPGTVVDTKICHLTELDFYLCVVKLDFR
ncbi:hypothetical protein L1987_84195 [Smallanthus sonchifolius]|uniref:Uncharacterized protein n=1 Tax=Smallanthus sonchifolius TaxID=185202 RepID=A0ACB8YEZ4_9ASTR|nr:hypothetical protein L1987_84195 [Smallanthus sonchifolius]